MPLSETIAAPKLDATDIQNAVTVIDYAAEQGAFRGWDTIIKVLNVRNQLFAFVSAIDPKNKAETTEPPPPPPTLNITDLQNVVTIIDYAAENGGFRGWETVTKVLDVRTRIATFVEAVKQANQNTPNDETKEAVTETAAKPEKAVKATKPQPRRRKGGK